jgi:hypothetical protein
MTLTGHMGAVNSLCVFYGPQTNPHRILSGSADQTIKVRHPPVIRHSFFIFICICFYSLLFYYLFIIILLGVGSTDGVVRDDARGASGRGTVPQDGRLAKPARRVGRRLHL